ncbi:MAG: hypothetical protein LBF70_02835 [Holosporales bacterium]|nr:hypothetical protein [Holosporales bacterium]
MTGCSSIESTSKLNITIQAIPYYQYRLKNILETSLSHIKEQLKTYKINISIKDNNETTAFSEKEIIMEGQRIAAHIEILDDQYNSLFKTALDSSSTYEVSDEFPYSGISAAKSSTDDMLTDLGRSVSLVIIAFIKKWNKIR